MSRLEWGRSVLVISLAAVALGVAMALIVVQIIG